MDFVDPEGFLIEGIKPKHKADEQTEDEEEGMALFRSVMKKRSKIQNHTPFGSLRAEEKTFLLLAG
jgi:hypothetical protein